MIIFQKIKTSKLAKVYGEMKWTENELQEYQRLCKIIENKFPVLKGFQQQDLIKFSAKYIEFLIQVIEFSIVWF